MMPGCKHITAFLILLLAFSGLFAQVNVRATVNRDKILIGESISLTVEAYVPLGSDINWFLADTIPHFLVTNRSSVDTVQNMDGKKISQELNITSFDSGQWQLPPFEIIVDAQPFYTDSVTINVGYTPYNADADYRDIKDIIEVVNPDAKYIVWWITGAAIVALAAMIYFLFRRRKPSLAVKKPMVPDLSPYEEAMKALRTLTKKYQPDQVKGFYSELNDILRKYVSRQFGMNTLDRTNEEMILQLAAINIPKDSFINLTQSLRMSDFVKFAKYRPSEQDNEDNLGVVKSSIELMDKRMLSAV